VSGQGDGKLPATSREGEACEACGTPPSTGLEQFADRHGLTPRELQVARCAASGSTNLEIAEHLAVNVRTVEGHLLRCYQKLDVHTRTRLAARVHRESVTHQANRPTA
jgi:DNA-binding NarL/FixJ family response regulator